MITRKQYLKTKSICKVTFRISKGIANGGHQAAIAGDFNAWDAGRGSMKTLRNGDFTITLPLAPGHEYQYRFIVDGHRWITDPDADKFIHCGYASCNNSVVVV